MSRLTWLDLGSNALTALPERIFSGLVSLETLWMNGNSLTELPEAVFRDLSRLVDLNLGFNSLTALPEGVFDGLSALQALGLHENSLMELPRGLFVELSGTPRQPARLDSLWLQGNRLRTLPEDVFRGLGNLRALLLNRNSLVALPEGVFRGLSHLQVLLLSDNSIASLPEEIFQGLSRLEELRLDGNRLAALPPGLLDDTLSELGIGPENQGLHLDAYPEGPAGLCSGRADSGPGNHGDGDRDLAPRAAGVPAGALRRRRQRHRRRLYRPVARPRGRLAVSSRGNPQGNHSGRSSRAPATWARPSCLPWAGSPRSVCADPTERAPDAPFLKAETLLSGSPDPASHTITLTGPADIGLNRSFVPVILSAAGMNGSFFTSEMTLTNRGPEAASLDYTYTAHLGSGSGTASEVVAAGRQKIVPDAIEHLRGLGLSIPASGNRIGTLAVEYAADSSVGVSVRTTTPVPQGRTGLAYPGVPEQRGFQEPVYLAGLRQTPQDRSNLAIQNMGAPEEGPITLRTTVFSRRPQRPGRPRSWRIWSCDRAGSTSIRECWAAWPADSSGWRRQPVRPPSTPTGSSTTRPIRTGPSSFR